MPDASVSSWAQYAPRAVLEFPRVEYIPIPVETLAFGHLPNLGPARPQVEPVPNLGRYRSLVEGDELALVASRPPQPEQNLTLLAYNLRILACYYRGLKATLLAEPAPGRVHLVELTRRFFYKDAFQLEAVDEQGNALARAAASLTPETYHSPRIGLFPS